MYVIRVSLRVKADALVAFEAQARAEGVEVPERFDGCLAYGFHARVGEPTAFLLYEEWRDQDAFDAYRKSDYFAEVGQRIRPLLAGPPDSAYYIAERAPVAVA